MAGDSAAGIQRVLSVVFNLIIIPAVPGKRGAFDSTFEHQGQVIHLPVGDLSRAFGSVFNIKMAPQCRAFTGLCIKIN